MTFKGKPLGNVLADRGNPSGLAIRVSQRGVKPVAGNDSAALGYVLVGIVASARLLDELSKYGSTFFANLGRNNQIDCVLSKCLLLAKAKNLFGTLVPADYFVVDIVLDDSEWRVVEVNSQALQRISKHRSRELRIGDVLENAAQKRWAIAACLLHSTTSRKYSLITISANYS